jgi:DNA modification methylase
VIIQASCERLPLAAESVDLIFTDPPYISELVHTCNWLAREAMRVLKPGGFVLAMCGGHRFNKIIRYFDDAGLSYFWKYEIEFGGPESGMVWHNGQNGKRTTIVVRTKTIIAYSKGKSGARTSTMGMFPAGGADKKYHHWGQDVASARYYIDCFSKPGDLVLDPFVGGGTTPKACELIGRRWLACDVDPEALATTAERMTNSDVHHTLPLFAVSP